MTVTVDDGRVTKVRGNPDHPFTQGGLCVKVTDFPNHIYAAGPRRVAAAAGRTEGRGPLRADLLGRRPRRDRRALPGDHRRARARGDPALQLPRARWALLNGLTVGDRFFNALGTSVSERTFCDGGGITGYIMTLGPTAAVDPESLVHSRYIIIWACNVLSNNLHLWPFIEEAQRRGAKVVCIDPVAHRTAKKADWHIPIRPGTDGALGAGDDARDHRRGAARRRLRRPAHRRLRAARRARRPVHARSGRPPRRASPPTTSARSPASTPRPSRR